MNKGQYPKITIVTPVYNNVKYIEDCIVSVLNQNYPNLEYIVIDGGSTDGTAEIIEKYKDKLAYFVREKDRGQTHALNKGFEKATGDVLAWLIWLNVLNPIRKSIRLGSSTDAQACPMK